MRLSPSLKDSVKSGIIAGQVELKSDYALNPWVISWHSWLCLMASLRCSGFSISKTILHV